MKPIEMFVSAISQNDFIKYLNETCMIESTDSAEEVAGKKKQLVALMMAKVRVELAGLAKESPKLKAAMDKASREQRQAEQGADPFVKNCKDLLKLEGK